MPKISDAARDARRAQFLGAAWRVFTRQGVAVTTMADITREAGLSSGSLYLYFPTKEDLIRAAITESLAQYETVVAAALERATATDAASVTRELLLATDKFNLRLSGVDLFALAVQGWAHAQTDPRTATVIAESYERIREQIRLAVAVAVVADAGAPKVTTAAQADVVTTILLGFVANHATRGTLTAAQLSRSLGTLFA